MTRAHLGERGLKLSTRWRLFAASVGPREVNHDYYTNWLGQDRIVILSEALAREMGVIHRDPPRQP